MNYKKDSSYYNLDNWKKFSKKEIFFKTYYLIEQCHFSPDLNYYQFKRQLSFIFLTKLYHSCLITKNNRSLISKFKLSRQSFNRKQSIGLITGVYKSIW